jgi:hypothetical protein
MVKHNGTAWENFSSEHTHHPQKSQADLAPQDHVMATHESHASLTQE